MPKSPRVECDECEGHGYQPPHVRLVEEFKAQIHDRAEQVDPSNEQDWYSLTLGWAIGRGLTPDDAHNFALHIRYHTELG